MKFKRHRKIKRYRKLSTIREYAVLFNNSNSLLDCVCKLHIAGILNSSLYTKDGGYQLIITTDQKFYSTLKSLKNNYIIFKDKAHIDDIKTNHQLICKTVAISKLQKAFKVI